jgi:CheY-like chemotaxis protein
MMSYLEAHDFQVFLARNGLEAVQIAQQHQPDLILMDIQMPTMDGLEAIRQIRSEAATHSIPIIALTALAMPGDLERCIAAGANHYLAKPVKLKQLLELIADYLAPTDPESDPD